MVPKEAAEECAIQVLTEEGLHDFRIRLPDVSSGALSLLATTDNTNDDVLERSLCFMWTDEESKQRFPPGPLGTCCRYMPVRIRVRVLRVGQDDSGGVRDGPLPVHGSQLDGASGLGHRPNGGGGAPQLRPGSSESCRTAWSSPAG